MLRRHAITRRRYAKCEIIGGRIRESKCFLFHSFRSSLLSFLFFRVINVSLPLVVSVIVAAGNKTNRN